VLIYWKICPRFPRKEGNIDQYRPMEEGGYEKKEKMTKIKEG
jgi:hypothetical protein